MAWAKGESGNPRGRKPGLTARGKFRKQVDAAIPEIVANVLQAALAGDMQAVKLILDRCIPALKPTSDAITLALPAGDLSAQGEAVIQATSTGILTPDQGAAVMSILSAQARIAETGELIQRLEALESLIQKATS